MTAGYAAPAAEDIPAIDLIPATPATPAGTSD
jgi:hypothetical protein